MIDALRSRLVNWGRWRWREWMVGCPDSSCQNPLYELVGIGDEEGYAEDGESGACLVVALRTLPAKAEQPEIDEEDAESLDAYVRQLMVRHRDALRESYVFRRPWPQIMVRGAERALMTAMDANYETIREMERRLRG
jgi:hypothetical protein